MHYSPTSLVKYMKCPYSFYLNRTIKLRGKNEGISVHKVLQHYWYFDLPKDEAIQASIDKYWDRGFEGDSVIFENFSKQIGNEKPLIIEEKLVVDDIVCVPDLVFSNKIVDYKTHNKFTKKVPIANKIQGVFISNSVKKLKGLNITDVEFWYLRKGYIQHLHIDDEIRKEVNDIFTSIKKKVENEEFPKNKSNCFFCDYKLVCKKQEEYVRKNISI